MMKERIEMTLNEIKDAVRKLERNELVELRRFVNIVSDSSNDLRIGMAVSFVHSRTGATIEGTIKKINPKKVRVDSRHDQHGRDKGFVGEWIVPPSMLRVIR